MSKPAADIFYGVNVRLVPRGPKYHVSIGGIKQIFDTQEKAVTLIEKLRAEDRAKRSTPAKEGE